MRYLILILPLLLFADPWGTDADLVGRSKPSESPKQTILSQLGVAAVRFHQIILHPIQGERSHFRPTSSHYTLQAMKHYGFVKGFLMGCDRLMRENEEPWIYPTRTIKGRRWKWDPPEKAPYSHYDK